MKLLIPPAIAADWDIDRSNIINSTLKNTHEPIFKFAYHVPTNEFLIMARPKDHEGHMQMIAKYGRHNFKEYIRGIWLKKDKIIYFREHFDEAWLKAAEKMLRENGVPGTIRIIWGDAAEDELENEPDLH